MIKSIYDMDLSDYQIKEGDVKVNADDLRHLFSILSGYHSILGCMLSDLNEEERSFFDKGLNFTEYAQNKYIVIGDMRREQKKWYDILKKCDDKNFTKNATSEEVDNLRREVWGYYIEAKTKRETLQAELDSISEK